MRIVSNRSDIAWISRRKSCAANRPSPSAPGGVFEVAAKRVPDSDSSLMSRVMTMVSPGSSSSNSSMQTSAVPRSRSTVPWKPSAPTRAVYSMKVPNVFRPDAAW